MSLVLQTLVLRWVSLIRPLGSEPNSGVRQSQRYTYLQQCRDSFPVHSAFAILFHVMLTFVYNVKSGRRNCGLGSIARGAPLLCPEPNDTGRQTGCRSAECMPANCELRHSITSC
jgi:hypothetical protein